MIIMMIVIIIILLLLINNSYIDIDIFLWWEPHGSSLMGIDLKPIMPYFSVNDFITSHSTEYTGYSLAV